MVREEIDRLASRLSGLQGRDGAWRFCCENGTVTDAFMIIVLRTLEIPDEAWIRLLHGRLLSAQDADGAWRLHEDEREGNLAATAENYYALLYSGYSRESDPPLQLAKRFILSKGGLRNVGSVLTKTMLAATGQYPWPSSLMIPIEFLLLPASSPISLFDFSGYARVHFIPMLLLSDRRFAKRTALSPDLSALLSVPAGGRPGRERPSGRDTPHRSLESLWEAMQNGFQSLAGLPGQLRETAVKQAETFMLERIESDGTLYNYATSTLLMLLALHAVGYGKDHPAIVRAVRGLKSMVCMHAGSALLQNVPSEVWDTALLSYALQEAGVPAESRMIRSAGTYLLARQHRKRGDWSIRNPDAVPGGWGFSDRNTINPDVDDSTAALRAIRRLAATDVSFRGSWDRGLQWTLSMQNRDGGWPAFEKNTDRELLTWLPIPEAKAVAIDPSSADLTGRTLEFLGSHVGFGKRHAGVRQGADWLVSHQEEDGSWYGRWGVCYIYGTWAALTGLIAAGAKRDDPAVLAGARWLLEIQNPDGGWGESCYSDRLMRYVPLGASTPSQTAWALDALIAAHDTPTPEIRKAVRRVASLWREEGWHTRYPTGAGLPGVYYSRYHSYRYIWPLLALSHYRNKYGDG